MSTLFWRRSAELILRSWPLSWPTAWPSSTPWRLRPLEPCLVPAACQFWAAPQLQMRRFNTRRLGRFSGVSDSFTESQRVGGSSSWGHLCHCHCYVVYHNLSYFQICSSLYSPQLCVGFLFLILYPGILLRPAASLIHTTTINLHTQT